MAVQWLVLSLAGTQGVALSHQQAAGMGSQWQKWAKMDGFVLRSQLRSYSSAKQCEKHDYMCIMLLFNHELNK